MAGLGDPVRSNPVASTFAILIDVKVKLRAMLERQIEEGECSLIKYKKNSKYSYNQTSASLKSRRQVNPVFHIVLEWFHWRLGVSEGQSSLLYMNRTES
jgi:hypothetical protein